MTIGTVPSFRGGQNLNEGQRRFDDLTLEEFLGQVKAEVESLTGVDGSLAKQGRATVSAAGDVVVAFTTAFASANYTLVFGYEDVAGGANDVVVQTKTGTKLAAGFTATVAGTTPDGILHWHAILDA